MTAEIALVLTPFRAQNQSEFRAKALELPAEMAGDSELSQRQ